MQIPVSVYSVGTVALNPQGSNPQVIRNAVQPLELRKPKHIEPLFFAVAHRGEGATPFSSLIRFAGVPPGSLQGGIADTRENGTHSLSFQNLPSISPRQSVGREAFQKPPQGAIRIWWGPALSLQSLSLIAGSEWPGKTAPFSSPGNSHAF